MRAAPVLVALALLAAACSGSTPVGQVGSTLSAMNGTVTLVKVLYPAPAALGSIGPALGHVLAAVVLTVHSPTSSPAKFAAIYSNSKLVDSHKLAHIGKSTAKYKVNECLSYPPFGSLAASQASTGCVVFQLAATATPVELKISGKAKADWTISATGFQPGTAPAPLPKEALPKRPTVPLTDGSGPTTTIAGSTSTTVAPGTKPAGGTTSTTPSTGAATTSTTTAKTPTGSAAPHAHLHGVGKTPRIARVTPRGAPVGSKVQIWGRKLSGALQVAFNGVPAFMKRDSAGRILVVVPAGATTGPVTVTTPSGTVSSPRSFVVL